MTQAELSRKLSADELDERYDILESLEQTQRQLQCAHGEFNRASAPELVEAAVFEINMLQARYAYLLRRVRELDIEFAPGPRRQLKNKRKRSA